MAKTYSQGDIVSDAKGQRLQLIGSEWRPIASANEEARGKMQRQQAEETPAWQAFLVNAGKALGGEYLYGKAPAGSMEALQEARPVSSFAGSIAPALLTGVATGGASAGMGLAARMGITGAAEAGLGALGDSENPLQAAAIQGTIGGLVPGVGPALRAGGRAAGRAMGNFAENAQIMGMGVPGIASRVQSRILNAAAAAEEGAGGAGGAGGGNRGLIGPQGPNAGAGGYLEGFLTPAEAKARGMPLTPGGELYLGSSNPESAAFAMKLRNAEELRSSDPTFGAAVNATRDEQRRWVTNRVAQAAGMEVDKPLTDAAVGSAFKRVGEVYDDVARQVGEVPIAKSSLGELEGIIIENEHRGFSNQIGKIHLELEGMLNKDGGVLSADHWRELNHTLGKKIDNATKGGEIGYLNALHDYQQILHNAMLEHAPSNVRQTLQAADEQYRILKILTRTSGVRSGNGEVNLPSLLTGFGNNPARYKTAGEDELMRELVTMRELQRQLTPNSGTAARLLANLPREAINAANKPFTWGVAGAVGASQLFGNK